MTSRYLPRIDQAGPGGGGPPPQIEDHFAPKVLVGNVPNGDPAIGQAAPFEYIPDPGDGSGILAAIAALGGSRGDIWLRPGLYDLSATGTIAVPTGVTLRGSGIGTVIRASPTARTAFDLSGSLQSTIEQMDIQFPPAAAGAVGSYVVALGVQSEVHFVRCRTVIGGPTADESLIGAIGGASALGCLISNTAVTGQENISQVGPFADYDLGTGGSGNQLVNNRSVNADVGIRVAGSDQMIDNHSVSACALGARLSGSRVRAVLLGDTTSGDGVSAEALIASTIEAVLTNGGPVGATAGVRVDGSCDRISIVRAVLDSYATGVVIATGATRTSIGFSQLSGNTAGITDAGTDTEQAHNQVP